MRWVETAKLLWYLNCKFDTDIADIDNQNFQIAALSPADINYEETLSTLRFGKPCTVKTGKS